MRISARINVDTREMRDKVMNDRRLWTFAAVEWHRLYEKYVPMRTGALAGDVLYSPGEIEHVMPYARRMYNGENFRFDKTLHPKASAKWDQAAAPTQLPKLASAIQAYIDQGRLDLE